MAKTETGIEQTGDILELAKLGLLFKSDTYKVHMMLMIGRADDSVTVTVNERRVDTATRMDELARELGMWDN